MFKQRRADPVPDTAGCAEEFRLIYIHAIVPNLLSLYCVPRGTGSRNAWNAIINPSILQGNVSQMANTDGPVVSVFLETRAAILKSTQNNHWHVLLTGISKY